MEKVRCRTSRHGRNSEALKDWKNHDMLTNDANTKNAQSCGQNLDTANIFVTANHQKCGLLHIAQHLTSATN